MTRLIRWMALLVGLPALAAGGLALASLTVGTEARAGVPKVVFGENFGATW